MHKLRAVRTLSWRDWVILGQAWVSLLLADWGLRLLSFQRVRQFVASAGKSHKHLHASEAATIQRAQWLVGAAARYHLYPMTCLRRALVLQWLLNQRGVSVDLQIGVRKEAGRLVAHAWVEHQGEPLAELEVIADRFTPLAHGAKGGGP